MRRRTPDRFDEPVHLCRSEFLSVTGAGRAGDGFVHERAAQIVGAGRKTIRGAGFAEFHPRSLDIRNQRMQDQPRDGMHEQGFAVGRPEAGASAVKKRGFHVHERQRNEFGDAAGFFLESSQCEKMTGPMPGASM